MNMKLERETDLLGSEIKDGGTPGSIEVHAKIEASGTDEDTFTVITPIQRSIIIKNGETRYEPIVILPLSGFRAYAGREPIPVFVHAATQIGPPLEMPHVRIILTNAIITTDTNPINQNDPRLQLLAIAETFYTGSVMVDVMTPNGPIKVIEGIPKSCLVFDVDTLKFTASDADGGEVPVYVSDQGSLEREVRVTLQQVLCILD